MNEPTYAAMGGAPKGYNAADYGRDVKSFKPFIKQEFPDIIFLGPGSVGEGGALDIQLGSASMLRSQDLLKAAGDIFDAFSYHYYGAASKRCAAMGPAAQTTANLALTQKWRNGSRRRILWKLFTRGFATRTSPGSRCGSRKPQRLHAEEIPGPRHSQTASAISIN